MTPKVVTERLVSKHSFA